MTRRSLHFDTVDVFTTERFKGNPLAIVHVPGSVSLNQGQKQEIAREFNYSETVFLHDATDVAKPNERRLDIFLPTQEVPFAGHPVIGTSWFMARSQNVTDGTLITKAGPVHFKVSRQGDLHTTEVVCPHDIKIDEQAIASDQLLRFQPSLKDHDNALSSEAFAVVDLVKGMKFIMFRLTSREALSKIQCTAVRPREIATVEESWSGFVGAHFHVVDQAQSTESKIKADCRLIEGTFEDPATGSASCAVAAYLATQNKGNYGRATDFEFTQGEDMGRKSSIVVTVSMDESGKVSTILLRGSAVHVMTGQLL